MARIKFKRLQKSIESLTPPMAWQKKEQKFSYQQTKNAIAELQVESTDIC